MLPKISLLALIFVLVQIMISNGAPMENSIVKRQWGTDYSSVYDDSVDWKTLNVSVIKLESNEKGLSENELFSKIEECVKKCTEKINSNWSARDQCIASMCDIYKK
jgi:hypothetical protein